MSDEAWIEQSLARLEELESHKAYLEAQGDTGRLAEVQAEITGLYEALEAVAAQDEAAEENSDLDDEDFPGTAREDAIGATPLVALPPVVNPRASFSTPVAARSHQASSALNGLHSPSALGGPHAPSALGGPFDLSDDPLPFAGSISESVDLGEGELDDLESKRGRSKAPLIAAAGLLVTAIGVGAFLWAGSRTPEVQRAANAAPAQVISASAIPADTQEPAAAKGADVARTQSALVADSEDEDAPEASEDDGDEPSQRSSSHSSRKKKKHKDKRSKGRRSSGSKSQSKRVSKDEDDGRKVRTTQSSDPLAGI